MFSPNYKMFSQNHSRKQMFSPNLFHKMFSPNRSRKQMFSPNLFHKTNVSRKVRKKMKGQPKMKKIKFNKEKPCCSERERQQRSFSNSTEKHFYQTFEPVQISEHVSLG